MSRILLTLIVFDVAALALTLALGLGPWLAAEVPSLVERGVIVSYEAVRL